MKLTCDGVIDDGEKDGDSDSDSGEDESEEVQLEE